MLEAFSFITSALSEEMDSVVLSYEERKKSRHRSKTAAGIDLGWFLERGHVLEDGQILACSCGTKIKIIAAEEAVSEVCSTDTLKLTRAAYHLGNRHVPLQVGAGFLRFQRDHVLDALVCGLGLNVSSVEKPFHPENGAYKHNSHSHVHSSDHHHQQE